MQVEVSLKELKDSVTDKEVAWRFICRFCKEHQFHHNRCCEVLRILLVSDKWMQAFSEDPDVDVDALPKEIAKEFCKRLDEVGDEDGSKDGSGAGLATLARSTLLAATQREQDKLVPLKYQYHLRPFRSRLPRGKAATADMADERRFEDIPMTQLVEQVMPLVPRLSSIHDYSVASPTRSV